MPKYIKDKTGKFAGSIGDGKTSVPTPASKPHTDIFIPASPAEPENQAEIVDTMFEHYQNSRKEAVWEVHEDADVSFWHCGRPGYWDHSPETGEEEVFCSKCQTMLVEGSTAVPTDAEESAFPFAVGEEYTTHRSHITGTIEEIVPNRTGSYRLRLNVDGHDRWTTALVSG